jgi:hypothetical protein
MLLVAVAAYPQVQYTVIGAYWALDGQVIDNAIGNPVQTRTTDWIGTHVFDGSAECVTQACQATTTYPNPSIEVLIGQNGGACAIYDPVTTNYFGGTSTSNGVPYIYVQSISADAEFPYGVPQWDDETCDLRWNVGGGGNFYCA